MRLAAVPDKSCSRSDPTAEQRMWTYYVADRSKGRVQRQMQPEHRMDDRGPSILVVVTAGLSRAAVR